MIYFRKSRLFYFPLRVFIFKQAVNLAGIKFQNLCHLGRSIARISAHFLQLPGFFFFWLFSARVCGIFPTCVQIRNQPKIWSHFICTSKKPQWLLHFLDFLSKSHSLTCQTRKTSNFMLEFWPSNATCSG